MPPTTKEKTMTKYHAVMLDETRCEGDFSYGDYE
jgi:hypothetical protein